VDWEAWEGTARTRRTRAGRVQGTVVGWCVGGAMPPRLGSSGEMGTRASAIGLTGAHPSFVAGRRSG
jgi:hypothetical protein